MIKYRCYSGGELDANSWIVYDDVSKKCLIIDLCVDFCEIEPIIKGLDLSAMALLLTHGHFDHSYGAKSAVERGIPVFVSKKDAHMLNSAASSLADRFGLSFDPPKAFEVIEEGKLDFGGIAVEVVATPGHTAGSLSYIIGDAIFCGDTLFKGSYGRYDLPTGDLRELIRSAGRILELDDRVICPGHGEISTIEQEKRFNPISRYAIQR